MAAPLTITGRLYPAHVYTSVAVLTAHGGAVQVDGRVECGYQGSAAAAHVSHYRGLVTRTGVPQACCSPNSRGRNATIRSSCKRYSSASPPRTPRSSSRVTSADCSAPTPRGSSPPTLSRRCIFLKHLGYTDVRFVRGGFCGWRSDEQLVRCSIILNPY